MVLTDEQLAYIHDNTNDSVVMLGSWLNSAALWETFFASVGLILCVTLVALVITKGLGVMRLYSR
jgi:hypothetical protein